MNKPYLLEFFDGRSWCNVKHCTTMEQAEKAEAEVKAMWDDSAWHMYRTRISREK